MPVTVSNAFREAMFSENTKHWVAVLLELSHPLYAGTLRVTTAGTRLSEFPLKYGLLHNSVEYLYVPMEFQLPPDIEGSAHNARLVIENVSRDLLIFVRSIEAGGKCTIKLISSININFVERQFPQLDIKAATWNAETITVEMGLDALDAEPIPADTFNPSGFPALF